eukprot:718128-Amphidinium_carterae.1
MSIKRKGTKPPNLEDTQKTARLGWYSMNTAVLIHTYRPVHPHPSPSQTLQFPQGIWSDCSNHTPSALWACSSSAPDIATGFLLPQQP